MNTVENIVDAEQRRAVHNALYAMPYAGLVMHKPLRDESFIEDLTVWLNALAAELRRVSERNDERERKLQQLEAERRGLRSLFGLAQLDDEVARLHAAVDSVSRDLADAQEGK